MDDITVKGVLHKGSRAFRIEQPLHIRFVFGEEYFGRAFNQQPAFAVVKLVQFEELGAGDRIDRRNFGAFVLIAPVPAVSKPDCREQMQARRIRPAIPGRDANQNILEIGFGVLDENIEITVALENSGVD